MTYHDRRSALHLYGRMAETYDLATAWLEPYRHRAVSELSCWSDSDHAWATVKLRSWAPITSRMISPNGEEPEPPLA